MPAFLLSAALFCAFLCCPAACAEGMRVGLRLAAEAALPALFPCFVVSGLLVQTGLADALARRIETPFARLFHRPAAGAAALVLGLCGGYPVGAAALGDLHRRGSLTATQAAALAPFVSAPGPAFCIGFVGVQVLGSAGRGAVLYAAQVGAALLCLTLTRGRFGSDCYHRLPAPAAPPSFAAAFCTAVRQAAQTALTVTAFLCIFSVLLALLEPVSLPPLAEAALELTHGLAALSAPTPLPVLAFLCGFGGLSVQAQLRAVLEAADIPADALLRGKLLHGALAAACAALLGLFTI